MTRKAVLLVFPLLVCLAACGNVQDTTINVTYDPCQPLAVHVADEATKSQRDGVAQALTMWNDEAGTQLTLDEAAADDVVDLRFEASFEAFHGVYLDETGEVVVNDDLTGRPQAITVAHELGHAFGLVHVDPKIRASVMNAGNLDVAPNAGDARDVREDWPGCGR